MKTLSVIRLAYGRHGNGYMLAITVMMKLYLYVSFTEIFVRFSIVYVSKGVFFIWIEMSHKESDEIRRIFIVRHGERVRFYN